ncbi:MAG: 30S ribosome-binding factor RbfA [Planctomycetes bacterium]|nr:30S ribosome-binding factor RbfA [Planctomycetota bacterium]
MGSLRRRRLEELLREEISKLVIGELADPRIGFTTVTGVKLDDDFLNAEVSVSFLLPDNKRSAALTALNSSQNHIRHKLLPFLKLKRAPKLTFVIDENIERAAHISDLLRHASETDAAGQPREPGGGASDCTGDEDE